jgi:hypothetical protein
MIQIFPNPTQSRIKNYGLHGLIFERSHRFLRYWFFPDICLAWDFKRNFSKSDHNWARNEFFKTLCFTLKYLISIVFVVVVVVSRGQFFSTKHQVLKNSLHGQISIDFEMVSLKILWKLWILLKWTIKNYTRQTPVILGKNKIQFSDEFCSVGLLPRARTINVSFWLVFEINFLQRPISTTKNWL